jgi:hypothetical protein
MKIVFAFILTEKSNMHIKSLNRTLADQSKRMLKINIIKTDWYYQWVLKMDVLRKVAEIMLICEEMEFDNV